MLAMLGSLVGPISELLDKAIPDRDLKEKLAHDIATMAERHTHEQVQAQLEINKTEAAHKNLFVAGWRPACGWVCVLGMAGNFLVIPLANMTLELLETGVVVPMIDLATMLPVLMGMLGLGGLRTLEKVKGAQKNH
jgi:hypothetical protein